MTTRAILGICILCHITAVLTIYGRFAAQLSMCPPMDSYLWDAETGTQLAALSESGPPIWSVAFSPDGTRIASGSGRYESRTGNSPIRIWGLP